MTTLVNLRHYLLNLIHGETEHGYLAKSLVISDLTVLVFVPH